MEFGKYRGTTHLEVLTGATNYKSLLPKSVIYMHTSLSVSINIVTWCVCVIQSERD
uniref:Uncharacterized protein n=1 Tax=Anguilla anguilla TaxID=7936 RepID=A0A0E9U5H3_ANGAN